MPDKKELIKEVILNNPNLSGNETYQLAKKKGIGIRKTDHFALVREVRDLPEPTIEKRERSIPIKHRIIKPEIIEPSKIPIPTKEGKYGIAEIYDKDSKDSYWIKYATKKGFNDQLDILKEKYQIENMSITFHGFNSYAEFIDKEFKTELESIGIFL